MVPVAAGAALIKGAVSLGASAVGLVAKMAVSPIGLAATAGYMTLGSASPVANTNVLSNAVGFANANVQAKNENLNYFGRVLSDGAMVGGTLTAINGEFSPVTSFLAGMTKSLMQGGGFGQALMTGAASVAASAAVSATDHPMVGGILAAVAGYYGSNKVDDNIQSSTVQNLRDDVFNNFSAQNMIASMNDRPQSFNQTMNQKAMAMSQEMKNTVRMH